MDAFTWIIILALAGCVAIHLFGHGHYHGGGTGEGPHGQRRGRALSGRSEDEQAGIAGAQEEPRRNVKRS